MSELRGKLGQALLLLFCKTILESDILAFHPCKLAQLLPQRINQDRAPGRGGDVQITDAKDFSCLLRVDGTAEPKEQGAKSKHRDFLLHVFLFSDPLVTRHSLLLT